MKRHYVVFGRVQGVNFRNSAISQARSLGVTGWVRNTADGAVEIAAEGEPEAMHVFERFLGRGPPTAEVERVETGPLDAGGGWNGFEAR